MFDEHFEHVYNGTSLRRLPWLVTLGNHDWRSARSPALQLAQTRRSERWHLPAPHHAVRVWDKSGSLLLLLLLIDTTTLLLKGALGLAWMRSQLAAAASNASWVGVVGHHALFTSGTHRGRTMERHRAVLLPLLSRHGVSFYISGHSHHTELLRLDETPPPRRPGARRRPVGHGRPISFIVAGAGSGVDAAPLCDGCMPHSRHSFVDALGYAELDAGPDALVVRLVDEHGRTRHEERVARRRSSE